MEVVGTFKLSKFMKQHAESRGRVRSWLAEARSANWHSPQDIKVKYPSASVLDGNRVIFDIKGNKIRLLCKIDYGTQLVLIKEIGTHAEYDTWEL